MRPLASYNVSYVGARGPYITLRNSYYWGLGPQ